MGKYYLKIIIEPGAPKELTDMIYKYANLHGPIVEITKLTEDEYHKIITEELGDSLMGLVDEEAQK